YSTNMGQTWIDYSAITTSNNGGAVAAGAPGARALAVFNGKLYAADGFNGKVYVSADGNNWTTTNGGAVVGATLRSLGLFNNTIVATDLNGKVYVSSDGTSWNASNAG